MIQLLRSRCYSHNKSVWGDRGMASAVTTGWHFCEIKGEQSASKKLTLPALTLSKVEIKASLQKIYSNSNAQSATVCLSGVYGASLSRKHLCTRSHTHIHTNPHTQQQAAWPADDVQVPRCIHGQTSSACFHCVLAHLWAAVSILKTYSCLFLVSRISKGQGKNINIL